MTFYVIGWYHDKAVEMGDSTIVYKAMNKFISLFNFWYDDVSVFHVKKTDCRMGGQLLIIQLLVSLSNCYLDRRKHILSNSNQLNHPPWWGVVELIIDSRVVGLFTQFILA